MIVLKKNSSVLAKPLSVCVLIFRSGSWWTVTAMFHDVCFMGG